MAREATEHNNQLIKRGLSEGVLADIAAALVEFEQTLEATRAGRRHEHVGASGDLRPVATEIREQVRLLDGLVHYRFGDDAELLAAWASARNSSRRSGRRAVGPFRSHDVREGGVGGETPE